MTTPNQSNNPPRPGIGSRDLIIVTYATCHDEGTANARAALGFSYGGSGRPEFNMGHAAPLNLPQRKDIANFIAIYRALTLAPLSYDLYLTIEDSALAAQLNKELKDYKAGDEDNDSYAQPINDEDAAKMSKASVIKSILPQMERRDREGRKVVVVAMEEVENEDDEGEVGGNWQKAAALAEASIMNEIREEKKEQQTSNDKGAAKIGAEQ